MWIPEGCEEADFRGRRMTFGRLGGPRIKEWYLSWTWGGERYLVAFGFVRYLDTKGKPPWRHRISYWTRHSSWNIQRALDYDAARAF